MLIKKKINNKFKVLEGNPLVSFLVKNKIYKRFEKECLRFVNMNDIQKKEYSKTNWNVRALTYESYFKLISEESSKQDCLANLFDWLDENQFKDEYIDWEKYSDKWIHFINKKNLEG